MSARSCSAARMDQWDVRPSGPARERARRLATALKELGIEPGDPVATLLWNQPEHLELYFAVPAMGAVIHTLNPRLHRDELSFIVDDAEDRAIVVDESLLDVFETFHDARDFEHVIVVSRSEPVPDGYLDYEALIESADADGLARARRAAGGRHLLHVGHDGAAQGRGLLPPLPGSALARGRPSRRQLRDARRHGSARGADVSRQRLGTHLHSGAGRLGPASFPGPSSTRSTSSTCWPPSGSRSRRECRRCGWPSCRRSTTSPTAGT